MVVQVNEFLMPFFFNGDTDNLTEEEINAVVKFQEKYGDCFDIFSDENGEWITNFSKCDLTGETSQVVYLYNTPEDKEYLRDMFE